MRLTKEEIVNETKAILKHMKSEVSPSIDNTPDLRLHNALVTHFADFNESDHRDKLEQNLEIAYAALAVWNNRNHRLMATMVYRANEGQYIQALDILEAADRIQSIRQITNRIITFAANHLDKKGYEVEEQSPSHIIFTVNDQDYELRYFPHLQSCALIQSDGSIDHIIFYSKYYRKAKKLFQAKFS